jgi:cytochrome c biogenesis protein CcdA
MQEIVRNWYDVLNSLFVAVGEPLRDVAVGAGGSIMAAVLLGAIGALSPCQLSTNASAIAYVGRRAGQRGAAVGWTTVAYVAGKVFLYSVAGLLVAATGQGLQSVAIPVVTIARKAVGPLMLLVGLVLLDIWRPRFAFGHRVSVRLRALGEGRGVVGAFLLGMAFSFAFCPTLALLLFAYVLPMAVASPVGPLYPGAFALGTTAPLLITAVALWAGAGTDPIANRLARWEPWLRKTAGLVFLLAGANDTVLYWFL